VSASANDVIYGVKGIQIPNRPVFRNDDGKPSHPPVDKGDEVRGTSREMIQHRKPEKHRYRYKCRKSHESESRMEGGGEEA